MKHKKQTVVSCSFVLLLTVLSILNISLIGFSYLSVNLRKSSSRDYWPTNSWLTSTPAEQGMSSSRLNDMIDEIESSYTGAHSVIIVKNGYMVLEQYFGKTYDSEKKHMLQSVTKSFTSTLIGIALHEGYINNIRQKVVDFFPDYTISNLDARKKTMTLEDLLTMTAGFDWDEHSLPYTDPNNSLTAMHQSLDVVQHVLDTTMAYEPGEIWVYNSGASILLGAIIQQVSGYTTLQFAKKYLFEPLGISDVLWLPASGGWYHTGGGLYLRPPDMVKLGYLYLNNGIWDGKEIISKDWVENATQTRYYPYMTKTTGYGYQWWTIPKYDIYCARGAYGQYIYVSPENDLVVGFNAYFNKEYPLVDALLYKYILPALSPDEPSDDYPTAVIIIVLIIAVVFVISIGTYLIRKKKRT